MTVKVSGVPVSGQDTLRNLVRTVSFDKLVWNRTHNTAFLKIKGYPIYTEPGSEIPKFTKLFKDGYRMQYSDDWEFGSNTIGVDSSFTDNIIIHDGTGSNYRIEYSEIVRDIGTMLGLTDTSDKRNRLIPARLSNKIITSFQKNSDFNYTVQYDTREGGHMEQIEKTFSSIMYIKDFEFNINISPWKLEIFKVNSKRNRKLSHESNTALIPFYTSYINYFKLTDTNNMDCQFMVRLRNIETNTITNWSDRRVSVRRYCLWQPGQVGYEDTRLGTYRSVRLV